MTTAPGGQRSCYACTANERSTVCQRLDVVDESGRFAGVGRLEELEIIGRAVAGTHEVREETASVAFPVHVHGVVDSQSDDPVVPVCAVYFPPAMDTNVAVGCNRHSNIPSTPTRGCCGSRRMLYPPRSARDPYCIHIFLLSQLTTLTIHTSLSLSLPAQDLPFSQIFPTIDSLPASGLTPRLYD